MGDLRNISIHDVEHLVAHGLQYTAPNSVDYCYQEVAKLFEERRAAIIEEYNLLVPLMNSEKLCSVTEAQQNDVDPYWDNGFFSAGDARVAYALAATLNPSKIVEIGSGNSTKFFRKAISDFGLRTKITSIDPAPRADISKVADDILRQSVCEVPISYFDAILPGDILFFDGSHYSFNGSDVTHVFLNILPRLPRGVVIQVHDITLPFEYVEVFTQRHYNEQYLLAALLFDKQRWQITLPLYWLRKNGTSAVGHEGVSLWMRSL